MVTGESDGVGPPPLETVAVVPPAAGDVAAEAAPWAPRKACGSDGGLPRRAPDSDGRPSIPAAKLLDDGILVTSASSKDCRPPNSPLTLTRYGSKGAAPKTEPKADLMGPRLGVAPPPALMRDGGARRCWEPSASLPSPGPVPAPAASITSTMSKHVAETVEGMLGSGVAAEPEWMNAGASPARRRTSRST